MRSRMLAGGQTFNSTFVCFSDRARHRSLWQGTRHLRRSKLGAFADLPWIDHEDKGKGRRAIWCSTSPATSDFRRSSNVRIRWYFIPAIAKQPFHTYRADDKTAQDFNISAGAVLHLVLALRGGRWSLGYHCRGRVNRVFTTRSRVFFYRFLLPTIILSQTKSIFSSNRC